MRTVPRRVAVACFTLSLLLSGQTSRAEKDCRTSRDAVRACLAVLREPVEQPRQVEPAGWKTAYSCLRKIGPDDRVLLPVLMTALHDPNPRIQTIAAEAIGNIGPEARDAVTDLRILLRDTGGAESEEMLVAAAAATALGQIGDDAIDAANDLVWAFRGVADYAARRSLLRIGPDAVPDVVFGAKDADPNVRERSVTLLPSFGCPASPDCDRLLDLLGDQSESHHRLGCCGGAITRVGSAAAGSLTKCGTGIVPNLRKRLNDPNPFVQVRAASVMAQLGAFDQLVADRLVQAVRRDETSGEALQVINETKRGTDPRILPGLRALLKDPNAALRSRAAVAMTGFDIVDADVLRAHLQRLADPDEAYDAADTLGHLETRLKPFECELVETATRATHYSSRWLAAGLLARITPNHPVVTTALAEIRKRVQSRGEVERNCALQAAFSMGEKGLPTVLEFLQRGERVVDTLPPGRIEKPLIAELLRSAKDPEHNWKYVSRLIEVADKNCSADALVPCLPVLVAHLRPPAQGDDVGTEPVVDCIVRCGKRAVGPLLRALREPATTPEMRYTLVTCLGQIGAPAKEALPLLAQPDFLKTVDSPWVVVWAIREIGPSSECLPFVMQTLDTENGGGPAQEAIIALGEPARVEVSKLLDSEDAARRSIGVQLLAKLGGKPEAGIPSILSALKRAAGNDIELMQFLASIGPAAKEGTPLVAARLTSRYVRVRSAACITLARIVEPGKPPGAEVLTVLSAATEDSFAEVRAAAADAIGLIGPPCGEARLAIERLRHDPFATVRHAADRAAQSLDNHRAPPAKIWTNYFDPSGPARGSALAANE
jgi:HEAT repeat protein